MRNAAELTDVIKLHLAGELLAFPGDVVGMVLNLERYDGGALTQAVLEAKAEFIAPRAGANPDRESHEEDGGEA